MVVPMVVSFLLLTMQAAPANPPVPPPARVVVPAGPDVRAEVARTVEVARQRFEARDTSGVLTYVSEGYRSAGFTKNALRQQLLTLFGLYQELRARVTVDTVEIVDGATWLYTTGEVSGRLPMMGWTPVLSWRREPEVIRREGGALRLIGFQD
jgi:hypothetical protein